MAVKTRKPNGDDRKALAELAAANHRVSFGPFFFMKNLRGLVRDRCPEAKEAIPSVHVHLMDGQTLEICHIIGIAPNWIALAVHETEHSERRSPLRTEMVPYHMIGRISIEANRHEGAHQIGFSTQIEPAVYGDVPAVSVLTPEEALKAVAGESVTAGRSTPPAATKRVR